MDSTMLFLPGLAAVVAAGPLVHRLRRPDGREASFGAAGLPGRAALGKPHQRSSFDRPSGPFG